MIEWSQAFTVALVAIVSSYTIHRMYQRRSNLPKIKSYLDNREKKISSEFKNKLKTLADASINFDIDLKKYEQFSKIVNNELSQIEKKIFIFEEIDSKLNERIKDYAEQKKNMDRLAEEIHNQVQRVSEGEKKYKQVSEALKNLNQQIKQKEEELENLSRVYSDSLNHKINEVKKSLDKKMEDYENSLGDKLLVQQNDVLNFRNKLQNDIKDSALEWSSLREKSEILFKENQEFFFNEMEKKI